MSDPSVSTPTASPSGPPGRNLGPIPGFTRPPAGRPWYRRWALWIVVLAAVIIAAVVSDIPSPQNVKQQATAVAGVVREISTGVHACEYAVSEAFRTFYGPAKNGTLSASSRSFAHQYLSQDQQACSFENTGIFGMATITVPNSPAGEHLSAMIKTVLEWSTSDANGAIVDIQTLVTHPTDRTALQDLATRERLLASDRAKAEGDLHAAEAALQGEALPSIGLPAFPDPAASPTSGAPST